MAAVAADISVTSPAADVSARRQSRLGFLRRRLKPQEENMEEDRSEVWKEIVNQPLMTGGVFAADAALGGVMSGGVIVYPVAYMVIFLFTVVILFCIW